MPPKLLQNCLFLENAVFFSLSIASSKPHGSTQNLLQQVLHQRFYPYLGHSLPKVQAESIFLISNIHFYASYRGLHQTKYFILEILLFLDLCNLLRFKKNLKEIAHCGKLIRDCWVSYSPMPNLEFKFLKVLCKSGTRLVVTIVIS